MKPKVAVFAFTSCEGCSLIMLEMEERLPDIMGQVEFVNFREVMDEKRDDYDIAIIDGAITRESEVEELKAIRGRAKIVVAMGACAVQGGLYCSEELPRPGKDHGICIWRQGGVLRHNARTAAFALRGSGF